MCRLVGLIANKKVDLRFSLIQGPKTFRDLGESNRDGWGVGWYENHTPKVAKEPIRAPASAQLPPLADEVESNIAICHVRKATVGSLRKENCHPFAYKHWLFCHNGGVNRDGLWALLERRRHDSLRVIPTQKSTFSGYCSV